MLCVNHKNADRDEHKRKTEAESEEKQQAECGAAQGDCAEHQYERRLAWDKPSANSKSDKTGPREFIRDVRMNMACRSQVFVAV